MQQFIVYVRSKSVTIVTVCKHTHVSCCLIFIPGDHALVSLFNGWLNQSKVHDQLIVEYTVPQYFEVFKEGLLNSACELALMSLQVHTNAIEETVTRNSEFPTPGRIHLVFVVFSSAKSRFERLE